MRRYYAQFEGIPEVGIFPTKQERDDWVNFKDEYSKVVGETPENYIDKRIAISAAEALECVGRSLYNPQKYLEEENTLPGVMWVRRTIPWLRQH